MRFMMTNRSVAASPPSLRGLAAQEERSLPLVEESSRRPMACSSATFKPTTTRYLKPKYWRGENLRTLSDPYNHTARKERNIHGGLRGFQMPPDGSQTPTNVTPLFFRSRSTQYQQVVAIQTERYYPDRNQKYIPIQSAKLPGMPSGAIDALTLTFVQEIRTRQNDTVYTEAYISTKSLLVVKIQEIGLISK